MVPPPPSASWEPLGDTFYRKSQVYDMQWAAGVGDGRGAGGLDLSDWIVVGGRLGGGVAMMHDESKPVLMSAVGSSTQGGRMGGKPKIFIYSSAGSLLQSIAWESPTRIVALGFTSSESLVVLTQDGTYRLYPLSVHSHSSSSSSSQPIYTQHSLGTEASESGILEAKIYEEGMVVLLGSLNYLEVRGWSDSILSAKGEGRTKGGSKVISLAATGLIEPPQCWCVVNSGTSGAFSGNEGYGNGGYSSRNVEVLICSGVTVLRLDEIEIQDLKITKGPFASIVPSPNSHFLALLSASSSSTPTPQLWVPSADFTRSLSEFDLGGEGSGEVCQVVWCGNNTVVVSMGEGREVVMVGPFGETLKYFYPDPVFLVGELDGTRILSNELCEFLQIVPQSSQDIFRPGSTSPSAILFEASEYFEKKSPKADEFLRSIREELTSAVDCCIEAAGREFEVYWQKKLLKAATFGKTFLDLYNPSDFVQMSQTLRVLNAARYYEIGIPLTYDQYQVQLPSHLIQRLTLRSQHLLALRISSFLHLSPAPVLKDWAVAKISAGGTTSNGTIDEDLCREIVSKLKEVGGGEVSCADVAEKAWSFGRTGLATKLLNFEPRASKQVPLLLNMKEDDLALVKAIESGDPDLVYTVLLHLKRVHSLGDFFRFVDKKPDAVALLQVYAKENDVELLRDFYYQDDRRKESACLALKESTAVQDFGEKVAKIRIAAKAFAEDKDCSFEAKVTDDHIKLLAYQQTLEQEVVGKLFVGLSINGTIRACLLAGVPKKADKVRSDFKVPDKRFWYIKLKALISLRDWESLEAFSRSKKSPIGYEPFVDELIAAGAQRQACGFVARCEANNRVELYVKCGEWVTAGQECVRRSDRAKLQELRQRCPNSVIGAQLDELYETLHNNGL